MLGFVLHLHVSTLRPSSFTICLRTTRIWTHAPISKNSSVAGGETVMTSGLIRVMPLLVQSCQKPLKCYYVIFSKPLIQIPLWYVPPSSHPFPCGLRPRPLSIGHNSSDADILSSPQVYHHNWTRSRLPWIKRTLTSSKLRTTPA